MEFVPFGKLPYWILACVYVYESCARKAVAAGVALLQLEFNAVDYFDVRR